MIANHLIPVHATHPGDIIKDELEYRCISQRKLAGVMDIRYTVLNEILNRHRPLTEKTALLFEAALGIDSETLMRLQTKYNMLTIKRDKSFMERLSRVRHIAAFLYKDSADDAKTLQSSRSEVSRHAQFFEPPVLTANGLRRPSCRSLPARDMNYTG